MERVRVTLAPEEYTGLVKLCEKELRSVSDQVRIIIRRELERRRLLERECKGKGVKHG